MTTSTITIGARRSDLARLQAYRVGQALEKKCGVQVKFQFKESLGDKNLSDPLWKMPEKGVFTEDFVQDLLDKKVDLVVHSWKDLPTERHPQLKIVGTLPREDLRDLLLIKKSRINLAFSRDHLKIFSSSPRREHHLGSFLKWALPQPVSRVEFIPVRGNVKTRLEKMLAQDIDGIVIAKAALDRLASAPETEFVESQKAIRQALAECLVMVLPLNENPAAAAQGALAIECCADRSDLEKLISQINCTETFESVRLEREILAKYGGGCHQKLGISCVSLRDGRFLRARGVLHDGTKVDVQRWILPTNQETKASAPLAGIKVFPDALSQMNWFERRDIENPLIEAPTGPEAFMVTKSQALPDSLLPRAKEAVLWAAGLETWKKLVARGLWVTGCSESLGENGIKPNLEILLGSDRKWVKLTHRDSEAESSIKMVATYEMLPNPKMLPDLAAYKAFFWPSYSHFKLAFEVFGSHLKTSEHFCGPGHTFGLIEKLLGHAPKLCSSFDEFQRLSVCPPK